MNIFAQESNNLVTAKTCGYNETRRVRYMFSESFHSLCMDKKAIIESEIEACERLLAYSRNNSERLVVEEEISELRMALDLLT